MIFSEADIERAQRIVKVATATTPPIGTKLDPYAYANNNFNTSVVSQPPKGFDPPTPGFWESAGKSLAGTVMKPFDYARSAIGMSPGRSMFSNKIMGGYGGLLGAKLFGPLGYKGAPAWEAEARSQIRDPMGWVGPYSRAQEQSSRYMQALPQYLSKHAPFFVHPIDTTAEFFRGRYGSPYPYP